jgi:protein TonB
MIYMKYWENPASNSRNEIVFSGRNRNYGAYIIRKSYHSSILKSFASSILLLTLIFAAPYIYSFFKGPDVLPQYKEVVVYLTQVKAEKKKPVFKPELLKESLPKNNSGGKPAATPLVKDSILMDTTVTAFREDTVITGGDIDSSGKGGYFNDENDTAENSPALIYADEMPQFPGGQQALLHYLSANISYPAAARENNIEGTVYINFIIDRNGWIKSPEVKRSVGGGCTEEAMRVLSKMPQWSPGKVNHHAVNVQFVMPVKFSLR